jgi:small subunit ribosomal protein S20
MAHHASAIKRIRQISVRRLRNRYQMKTSRNLIKKLRSTNDKAEASELYNRVASLVDRLAKTGVIHKNNASNKKSKLAKYINHLQ